MRAKLVCDNAILREIDESLNQIVEANGGNHTVSRICARRGYRIGVRGFLFYLHSRFGESVYFFVSREDCDMKKVKNEDGQVEAWPQFEPLNRPR